MSYNRIRRIQLIYILCKLCSYAFSSLSLPLSHTLFFSLTRSLSCDIVLAVMIYRPNIANDSLAYFIVTVIIRQRGRRSNICSPQKIAASAPVALSMLRTPTKASTPIRSSPRKRLHLADTARTSTRSPRKSALTLFTPPQTKRMRLAESPMAQQNVRTPLGKVLKGYSPAQLIEIIQDLCSDTPTIEGRIRAKLVLPDIAVMEAQLIALKKNIFKSLPSSRLTRSTDAVAYARVATHLSTFNRAVIDQSQQLSDSENWDALVDYVLMAWKIIRATPVWENKTHNAMRRCCFKAMASQCMRALKHGGLALGEKRLNHLSASIDTMKVDCDDITSCTRLLDEILEQFAEYAMA